MTGWRRWWIPIILGVACVGALGSAAQEPAPPPPSSAGQARSAAASSGKQLIVYVQQPVFGKRTLRVGLIDYGHTFLGIRDPATGFEQKFGFYPSAKAKLMLHGHTSGAVHSDEAAPWDVRMVYNISEDDARRLIMSISAQLPDGKAPDFDMKGNNCSTWALSEARIAGVEVKTKQRCKDQVCVNVPADIGQDLIEAGGEVNKVPWRAHGGH